ncbi:AraC family transcriptional regulator [Achromobacter sp. HZ01]|uniref:AraC family transcriptional regulator n=1 Tax=Achromobacter sp. HZ01 TaxID=1416886 RepID=UPI000DC5A619|nr:helix-turn-helix transcriptional regulator [Achromobacter sp. HZ01]RAP65023.1 AraC family transcriptional regulator [Achromobacter sp. HZ01]
MTIVSALDTENLDAFETSGAPVIGRQVELTGRKSEVPVHRHRYGQLVLALRGGVTCEVPNSIWMVPPGCAVWIPGQMEHSMRATDNAHICNLFVRPDAARLPQQCCTLSITPLVRELILDLAQEDGCYAPDSPTGRKAVVLLEELVKMPLELLHLPTSSDPRMRRIATMLTENPADRRTLEAWGREVAMSERSLARLVRQEVGLSFGHWRRQLHLIVAMHQLADGISVQRVADHLGYESVTAFISMFRKAVGKPPAKYFAELARAGE